MLGALPTRTELRDLAKLHCYEPLTIPNGQEQQASDRRRRSRPHSRAGGRGAHEGRFVSSANRAWTARLCRAGRSSRPGPGLPMPDPGESGDEPWRIPLRETRFVPMQARAGDYALFFRKAAVEITFEGDTYLVIPQSAILALVRDSDVED